MQRGRPDPESNHSYLGVFHTNGLAVRDPSGVSVMEIEHEA